MKCFDFLAITLLSCALIACREEPAKVLPTAGKGQTNQQIFFVKGVVKKLDSNGKTVTIQHEEVPNYMPAMTMPFEVKDSKELQGLQPGDAVSFRMSVTPDQAWIDQVQKTGVAQLNEPPSRPSIRLIRDVEPLNVGDVMPDYRFTNELGQAVGLSDFKGQALALTFIFTRCPMPDFCPLVSKNFAAAYLQLSTMPNAPTNWHLLSISFDPHFDTPAVLKAYAESYHYDTKRWSFVTGAMIDIDAITEQFNLPIFKQGENWDHKLRTAIIDAQGRVQKIFIYNQWKPEELVDEIIKAASVVERKELPATRVSN